VIEVPRFNVNDFESLERAPSSPASLRNKITEMLYNSTVARVKVEAVNPDTGQYRIVLQGTLDREGTKWEEK
jgi:hypothetical protein